MHKFTCCRHGRDTERRGCNRTETLAERRTGGRQKRLPPEVHCSHIGAVLTDKLPLHVRCGSMQSPSEGQGVGLGGASPVQGPGTPYNHWAPTSGLSAPAGRARTWPRRAGNGQTSEATVMK